MSRCFLLRFGPATLLAGLAALVLSVVLSPQMAAADDLGPLGQRLDPALHTQLQAISRNSLDTVPAFANVSLQKVVEVPAGAADSDGPPLVLYIGAGFCPYCAALRWPLALTLMRFGDLNGLLYTRSSGQDVYPNTATFSFRDAHFASALVNFEAVEISDRNRKPVDRPTDAQKAILTQLDKQPYTRYPGSIPFLYVAGQYVSIGSPFNPGVLKYLNWKQIAERLEQGDNATWQSIMSQADLLTAAVCSATGQKPDSVCTSKAIVAAAKHLP